ncbi:MAG: glycerophosphodiester phosphodiesterase family protein [Planctomycetes bacterium]|nr:glycerophosphodiester phosphodiesterase family protein [Planctomycetota bacterium]
MLFRFALLLTVVCASSASAADATAKRVIVIAHRGAHGEAPENSLAAMRKAAELTCDYVEVDVRTTRDHELVLMHDGSVDRTTTGKGRIEDMTLAEIRELHFKRGQPNEKVPTFDEALAVCKGRIKVYIDHKNAAVADVLAAVERHKMLADVVVYGSVKTLREYKRLKPKVWIMPPHPGDAEEIRKLVADLKPETLDGNIVEWKPEHVKAAHEAGAQVWVDNPGIYDTESGVRKAIELGVDAIQTDHPERLIELLRSQKAR